MTVVPSFLSAFYILLSAILPSRLRDWRDVRDWLRPWLDPPGFFQGNCTCCAGLCCSPTPPGTLHYSIASLSNCTCGGFPKTGTLTQGTPGIWTGSINNADGCGLLTLTLTCQFPQTSCGNFNINVNNVAGCNASASANPNAGCSCPLNVVFDVTICTSTCSCCGGGNVPSKAQITVTE